CNLAMGYDLPEAIANAKKYITGALKAGLNLGKGSGPLNHMYAL
ncbi:MAG: bifunctional hydroxymethylpyrimidine kinase/phosphomethylpyrimidine kinase, partial [Anaerovibrio sp.]|nr:bifunctional hydroxymethylpyrimidine kinase/phosphomethylpyrimidine kinase [Anaerovibrio sp.]